ncbi:RNA-directed DNA polymerase [Phocaeicola sp.]
MEQKQMTENGELFSPCETGGIAAEEVFDAYFACRRKKRGTHNALAFEADYERKCIELWRDINAGTYKPSRSVAFIVFKPVQREVFAADFRDRVVHHLIARKIEPLLEAEFIDDSYSTRVGKGTLYGIRRVEGFVRECSAGYTQDCYVMKLDIRSFFMNISKELLCSRLETFLREHYRENDREMLLYLLRETLFNCPEKNCIRRCPVSDWKGLPRDKSLFHSDGKHGLPIGNLTSQMAGNFFLSPLDHLVTEQWGVPLYGRYVDDMVLVHPSREHLLAVRERIREWLTANGLTLHPRKMYLQHYSKGIPYIGGVVKPGRKYISNRTVGYFQDTLEYYNRLAQEPGYVETHGEEFVSSVNSYLGQMKHFATYNLRKKLLLGGGIAPGWWKVIYASGHLEKIVLKKRYTARTRMQRSMHREIVSYQLIKKEAV